MSGSCACCTAVQRKRIAECTDCQAVLVELRREIDTLAVDTLRFFPVVNMLLTAPQREVARDDGASVEHRIAAVIGTFERLVSAVDEFQVGCRASHLGLVKQMTADLLVDANGLDQLLKELP